MDDKIRRIGPSDLLQLRGVTPQQRAETEAQSADHRRASSLPALALAATATWPQAKPHRTPSAPLTAGSSRPCPDCGRLIGTVRTLRGGQPWYCWRVCLCQDRAVAERNERVHAIAEAYRQQQADMLLGDTGMRRIAHLTLDCFDPVLLRAADPEAHPYQIATEWLTHVLDYGPQGDLRDPDAPTPALYFYCPGRGRGKTHLAAGLLWQARAAGRLTAFVEEASYLDRSWSCPMEDKERLAALPGEQAWLTVVDDLGTRGITRSPDSVQNAWYAVFSRRTLPPRWTIITSNWTLEELLEQRQTINESTYSRIRQLTGGNYVFFDGDDQRLI